MDWALLPSLLSSGTACRDLYQTLPTCCSVQIWCGPWTTLGRHTATAATSTAAPLCDCVAKLCYTHVWTVQQLCRQHWCLFFKTLVSGERQVHSHTGAPIQSSCAAYLAVCLYTWCMKHWVPFNKLPRGRTALCPSVAHNLVGAGAWHAIAGRNESWAFMVCTGCSL